MILELLKKSFLFCGAVGLGGISYVPSILCMCGGGIFRYEPVPPTDQENDLAREFARSFIQFADDQAPIPLNPHEMQKFEGNMDYLIELGRYKTREFESQLDKISYLNGSVFVRKRFLGVIPGLNPAQIRGTSKDQLRYGLRLLMEDEKAKQETEREKQNAMPVVWRPITVGTDSTSTKNCLAAPVLVGLGSRGATNSLQSPSDLVGEGTSKKQTPRDNSNNLKREACMPLGSKSEIPKSFLRKKSFGQKSPLLERYEQEVCERVNTAILPEAPTEEAEQENAGNLNSNEEEELVFSFFE